MGEGKNRNVISFRMPYSYLPELDKIAKNESKSYGCVVRDIVCSYIDNKKEKKKKII